MDEGKKQFFRPEAEIQVGIINMYINSIRIFSIVVYKIFSPFISCFGIDCCILQHLLTKFFTTDIIPIELSLFHGLF